MDLSKGYHLFHRGLNFRNCSCLNFHLREWDKEEDVHCEVHDADLDFVENDKADLD